MHIYIYYMICVLFVIMYQDTMYKKIAAWILAGVICRGYLLLAQVEFWHGSGRTWLLGTSVQCQNSHQTPCWMVKKPHIKIIKMWSKSQKVHKSKHMWICGIEKCTPRKINMEHNHGGLVRIIFLSLKMGDL